MTETAFIWRNVAPVTDSYHNGGGLLVIAQTVEGARAAALAALADLPGVNEADWRTADPDMALPLSDVAVADEGRVVVFPDQGCC